MARTYNKTIRRAWIKENLDWIEEDGLSQQQIAQEVKKRYQLSRAPSQATISIDLREIEKDKDHILSPEARRLLQPENFPEFRELFDTGQGIKYVTNKTQHALYWVLYALTRKVDLPEWVIEHFELPADVNEDIVEREKLLTFILLVAPRHGKTMALVHGLIALIAEFPNVAIVYCQGVKETTEDIMKLIMMELEFNQELVELFGSFRHDDRQWSKEKGFVVAGRSVPRISPTFLPAGINTNVRSRDADIILIDDPQDEPRANNELLSSKDYKKVTNEFMQRREPHTPVLMVGSHVPSEFGDVFTKLEDNLEDLQTEGQAIILNKRPAHFEDRCLVPSGQTDEHWDCLEWPEYRPWEFLMSQKALLDSESPGMYDAVYQQMARVPGSRPFLPEVVKAFRADGGVLDLSRSWKTPQSRCPRENCGGELYTTLGFDPAAGEGKRASYTAVGVLEGCTKCYTLYLLDYEQMRLSPDYHASTIGAYARSYDIDYARIEINAYQKALARDKTLLELSRDPKHGFHIWEHMTDDKKNTPEFGIPKLAKWMREDRFSVPYATPEDESYAKALLASFIRYPAKPNDIPMAVWLAAGMMWEMFEMYMEQEPVQLPGAEFLPAYLQDEAYVVDLGKMEYKQRRSVG